MIFPQSVNTTKYEVFWSVKLGNAQTRGTEWPAYVLQIPLPSNLQRTNFFIKTSQGPDLHLQLQALVGAHTWSE